MGLNAFSNLCALDFPLSESMTIMLAGKLEQLCVVSFSLTI
jgi:hypothetical protein